MSPFGRGGRSQSGPDRAAFFRLRRSGHGEALLLRRPSVRLSQKGLLEERLFCRSAQSLNFHQIIHKNTFTYDFLSVNSSFLIQEWHISVTSKLFLFWISKLSKKWTLTLTCVFVLMIDIYIYSVHMCLAYSRTTQIKWGPCVFFWDPNEEDLCLYKIGVYAHN
jgi:hypothetical protein